MQKNKLKQHRWRRRQRRIRGKIQGEPECPRLSVFRSARHMYAQLIDDSTGNTVVAASTVSKDFDQQGSKGNKDAATIVGADIARKALAIGVHKVRFDRSGYRFHGRIKALADAARKEGLVF